MPEKTGYGTASGLLGVNCRHKFYTYIDGITNENEIVKIDKDENERIYKANQELRGIERNIRKYKLAEIDDKQLGLKSSPVTAKVKEWQKRAREHCEATGVYRHYNREKIADIAKKPITTAKSIKKSDIVHVTNKTAIQNNILPNKANNIQYIEATSIKQAEEFAKSLGIKNVGYSELDLKVVNEINKALYETITEFPEVLQQLKYVGTPEIKNELMEKIILLVNTVKNMEKKGICINI